MLLRFINWIELTENLHYYGHWYRNRIASKSILIITHLGHKFQSGDISNQANGRGMRR